MCERECFKRRRGDAPIIATIILMAITVFTVFVTLTFVNSNLTRREGENDFTLAQSFMRTVGLAVDDVAWKQGQTDSIPYGSKQSEMMFYENVFSYKITINYIDNTSETLNIPTNAFFYSLPLIKYSLKDGDFEGLLPRGDLTLLVQDGAAQPSARVFWFQKNPLGNEGDYIRVGVIPLPRQINYSITIGSNIDEYMKLFIPKLVKGNPTPSNPQYVTLTGIKTTVNVYENVESINVKADFSNSPIGFDKDLFFPEWKNKGDVEDPLLTFVPGGGRLEVSTGEVRVDG